MYSIALDNDRDIAAELGLLLSCYAIIDLFIPQIFSVISGHSEDSANIFISRIKGNSQRIFIDCRLADSSLFLATFIRTARANH